MATSVTDLFITSPAAARERGRSVLSASGRRAAVTLNSWLSDTIGLVTPGTLIEVTNGGVGGAPAWRGLIRSTAISAATNDAGAITVGQVLGVERLYN